VKRALLPLAKRVTFVIDPEGRIAARFAHEFQVSRHLDDVLRYLRETRRAARSA
jgi:peroxiredoxin Q/BCP